MNAAFSFSFLGAARLIGIFVFPWIASGAPAFPFAEATIAEIQAAYLAGKITAHDVTAAFLARIEAYDKRGPYLNSIISVNP